MTKSETNDGAEDARLRRVGRGDGLAMLGKKNLTALRRKASAFKAGDIRLSFFFFFASVVR